MMPRSANKSSTSRKLEELVSDREGFFDQFDEAGVDFSLGAIPDDEALALAGAPHLRFDRQGDGVDIRPLAPSSRFQRRGDFRGDIEALVLDRLRALLSSRTDVSETL